MATNETSPILLSTDPNYWLGAVASALQNQTSQGRPSGVNTTGKSPTLPFGHMLQAIEVHPQMWRPGKPYEFVVARDISYAYDDLASRLGTNRHAIMATALPWALEKRRLGENQAGALNFETPSEYQKLNFVMPQLLQDDFDIEIRRLLDAAKPRKVARSSDPIDPAEVRENLGAVAEGVFEPDTRVSQATATEEETRTIAARSSYFNWALASYLTTLDRIQPEAAEVVEAGLPFHTSLEEMGRVAEVGMNMKNNITIDHVAAALLPEAVARIAARMDMGIPFARAIESNDIYVQRNRGAKHMPQGDWSADIASMN